MFHGRSIPTPLPRLFDGSAPAALTDGELLARFVADRDEVAFEGLVARLGPMVLGVARRMLGDRGEADDAFQATFLVLVRRAGAVGRGDLIGPWLHGVAVRVCRKARAQAARRRGRERADAGGTLEIPAPPAPALAGLAGAETLATIDAEIARLPESYRRLVVLCDVEGLSRDEAADRLGWTPNMVRGRLARARSQLRANLARRGCTPPGHAGAEGWGALPWLLTPSPSAVLITARAALATLSPPGRGATLLASASALSLAQGVTRTMTLTSWKFAGFGLLAAGTLAAGTAGAILAQASAVPGPPATAVAPRRAEAIPPVDAPLQALLEERLRNAQGRFDAQFNFYRNARTDDIGRVIDASRQVHAGQTRPRRDARAAAGRDPGPSRPGRDDPRRGTRLVRSCTSRARRRRRGRGRRERSPHPPGPAGSRGDRCKPPSRPRSIRRLRPLRWRQPPRRTPMGWPSSGRLNSK